MCSPCIKKTCKGKKGRGTKIRHESSPQGGTLLPTATFTLPLLLLLVVLALLLLVPLLLGNHGLLGPRSTWFSKAWAQVRSLLWLLAVLVWLLLALLARLVMLSVARGMILWEFRGGARR